MLDSQCIVLSLLLSVVFVLISLLYYLISPRPPPTPTPHRKLLLVPPGNVLYYRDLKQSHAVVRATTKT